MPKYCQKLNCKSIALYGNPGEPIVRCEYHVEDGMMKFPYMKCFFHPCDNVAVYGIKPEYPQFCQQHTSEELKYLVYKQCSKCSKLFHPLWCLETQQLTNACKDCLNDEWEQINKFMQSSFEMIDYSQKLQDCQCVPHFIIKSNVQGQFVAVIVEQNQNKSTKPESANEQLKSIQSVLGSQIVFVKFNIDEYKAGKKKQVRPLDERLKVLKDIILEYQDKDISNSEFIVKKIYYDGFNI